MFNAIEDFQACDFSLSENTCIKHTIFHFHLADDITFGIILFIDFKNSCPWNSLK